MSGRGGLAEALAQRFDCFRHVAYAVRLLCGGVVAGFFVGVVLATLMELVASLTLERSTVGIGGIFLAGAVIGTLGGAWGAVLGFTERDPRP